MIGFDAISLGELEAGQMAVVEDVCCSCEGECQRLQSLGFCCGAMVRMLAAGAPCAVQVGDSRVMLRGEHTDSIRVSLIA